MNNIQIEQNFTRNVSDIGHYGIGNLFFEIRSKEDIENAKQYINESYENNYIRCIFHFSVKVPFFIERIY